VTKPCCLGHSDVNCTELKTRFTIRIINHIADELVSNHVAFIVGGQCVISHLKILQELELGFGEVKSGYEYS